MLVVVKGYRCGKFMEFCGLGGIMKSRFKWGFYMFLFRFGDICYLFFKYSEN